MFPGDFYILVIAQSIYFLMFANIINKILAGKNIRNYFLRNNFLSNYVFRTDLLKNSPVDKSTYDVCSTVNIKTCEIRKSMCR